MTDPDLPVDCPQCGGGGEVGTGRREWETGAYETEPCRLCNGHGEVPAFHLIGYDPDDYTPRHTGWI